MKRNTFFIFILLINLKLCACEILKSTTNSHIRIVTPHYIEYTSEIQVDLKQSKLLEDYIEFRDFLSYLKNPLFIYITKGLWNSKYGYSNYPLYPEGILIETSSNSTNYNIEELKYSLQRLFSIYFTKEFDTFIYQKETKIDNYSTIYTDYYYDPKVKIYVETLDSIYSLLIRDQELELNSKTIVDLLTNPYVHLDLEISRDLQSLIFHFHLLFSKEKLYILEPLITFFGDINSIYLDIPSESILYTIDSFPFSFSYYSMNHYTDSLHYSTLLLYSVSIKSFQNFLLNHIHSLSLSFPFPFSLQIGIKDENRHTSQLSIYISKTLQVSTIHSISYMKIPNSLQIYTRSTLSYIKRTPFEQDSSLYIYKNDIDQEMILRYYFIKKPLFIDYTSPYEELGRFLPSSALQFYLNESLFTSQIFNSTSIQSCSSPCSISLSRNHSNVLYLPHFYLKTIVPDSTMRYDCITIGTVCIYLIIISLLKFFFVPDSK